MTLEVEMYLLWGLFYIMKGAIRGGRKLKNILGKCLCGETVIKVDELDKKMKVCHCSMCRKQTAGPTFYAKRISRKKIHFESDNHLSTYSSSIEAERAFCNKCGTVIYFHEKDKDSFHFNIELFDEIIETIHFEKEFFYKDKPDYYIFKNQTKKYE